MNRRSLIKSLFIITVAPKVLAELKLDTPIVAKPQLTKAFLYGLVFQVPDYMPALIEKYRSTNWMEQDLTLLEEDRLINPKLYAPCQST